ncbi:hypothetical protein BDR06DRAFT_952593 [Suillus hirtellus]|nr:hypothetical protein BDR06DRAFT_952593 [Suillus hirtellus]
MRGRRSKSDHVTPIPLSPGSFLSSSLSLDHSNDFLQHSKDYPQRWVVYAHAKCQYSSETRIQQLQEWLAVYKSQRIKFEDDDMDTEPIVLVCAHLVIQPISTPCCYAPPSSFKLSTQYTQQTKWCLLVF